MAAAGEVVAELVGEQNGEQGDGEREAVEEAGGLLHDPANGHEVVGAAKGGVSGDEVCGKAGAHHGRG